MNLLGSYVRLLLPPCRRSVALDFTLRRGFSPPPSLLQLPHFLLSLISHHPNLPHVETLLPTIQRNSLCPYADYKAYQDLALVFLWLSFSSISLSCCSSHNGLFAVLWTQHSTLPPPGLCTSDFFFFCLDLAFSRSLCDSLSHLLSSLFPCFLWDVPYTLFITLSPTISLATFIFLISNLSFETPNISFIYIVYSLPLHTPLEYNFHKDGTFLNSFLFSVWFCFIIALSSQCREKTGTYRVSLNVGWMNGMQARRN